MGKDDRQKEVDRLHEQASRATIGAYRLAWAAIIVSIVTGIFGPAIAAAVDKQTPVFIKWFAAQWSLPWPVIAMLVFLGLLFGRRQARREYLTVDHALITDRAPAPKPAGPPEPQDIPDIDRRILRLLASSDGLVHENVIMVQLAIDRVATQAALIRLLKLRLLDPSNRAGGTYWQLSAEGTLYVDRHRGVILH